MLGFADFHSAITPATHGAALDVPENTVVRHGLPLVVVVPVGPGEDDMPQFDERDLPQA